MFCNIFILPITTGRKSYNQLKLRCFMPDKDPNQAVAAQKFWDAFKACLEENRVQPDRSNFFLKWA